MNDAEFDHLKARVLALAGIDLDCYKSQQMRRRLDGFVATQAPTPRAYCATLERDLEALRRLRQFLTINVSEFFRDPEQFQVLKTTVLPGLLRRSPSLKVWSAGCSHGEEPYSLAILLRELAPDRNHRVLATDMNDRVLAMARQGGPYEPAQVRNVDQGLLRKYFSKTGEGYSIDATARGMVRFAQHNLLGDPFESGFDLIVCRNVVIYFTDEAKTRLTQRFWQALKDEGVLFVGACEYLGAVPEGAFTRVSNSVYRKQAHTGVYATA